MSAFFVVGLAIGGLAFFYRLIKFVWIAFIKESILCDICLAPITDFENDIYHHTGLLHGKLNAHVHLCQSCQKTFNPPCFDFDSVIRKKA